MLLQAGRAPMAWPLAKMAGFTSQFSAKVTLRSSAPAAKLRSAFQLKAICLRMSPLLYPAAHGFTSQSTNLGGWKHSTFLAMGFRYGLDRRNHENSRDRDPRVAGRPGCHGEQSPPDGGVLPRSA